MRKREERRRNIVIRGVEGKEERRREVVERLFKKIGAEVKIEDIKVVGGQREKGKGVWIVKLASEIQKREIMKKRFC